MGLYFNSENGRTEYLDNLPLNTLNQGLIEELDIARVFAQSDNYYFQGVPFPTTIAFTARQAKSGVITIPAGSYLLSLTGDCFVSSVDEIAGLNAGFTLRIYDKGAKAETAINAQFMKGKMISGVFRAANSTIKQAQYWLKSPMIVTNPGALQIEITALSSVDSSMQVMFGFATPLTKLSMGEVQITRNAQS